MSIVTGQNSPSSTSDDSWGGWAVVWLTVCVLGYAVLAKTVDGMRSVTLDNGRQLTVRDGDISSLFGIVSLAIAMGCGLLAFSSNSKRTAHNSVTSLALQGLVLWWVAASLLTGRGSTGLSEHIALAAGAVLVLAVATAPPTGQTLKRLNVLRDLYCASSLLYAMLASHTGTVPCRPDKCGAFGSLLTGFFNQENTAALVAALLLPPIVAANSGGRMIFSALLTLTLIAATGSRTSLASCLVTLMLVMWLRRGYARNRFRSNMPLLGRLAPLGLLLFSLIIFLAAPPYAFTGRGAVYSAIREALGGASTHWRSPGYR